MRLDWRRRLTGVLVLSLGVLAIGAPTAGAEDIDTTPAWNGAESIGSFGYDGSTPTYGQTVTGTGETLTGFTVYISGPSSMTFTGGVGVWDGGSVTGVLWSGPDQQTPGGEGFAPVSFEIPAGVSLAPGQTYVLYATTLASSGSGAGVWGSVDGATYADGHFVFQNGNSLTEDWDGREWLSEYDLAFQARFGNKVKVVFVSLPARGGYCTVEGNTDPFTGAKLAPGTFVNLEQAQVTSDPSYAGVVPAIYVEGKGLTCDAPPAGFTQQGLAGDAQQVASGLYPLYAAPGK